MLFYLLPFGMHDKYSVIHKITAVLSYSFDTQAQIWASLLLFSAMRTINILRHTLLDRNAFHLQFLPG